MEKLASIISNNLTFLRKNAGLTQLEFGEKFNYSDKTVSKWELGVVIPSVETLKEIADFYGVSMDYLVSEHKSTKDFTSAMKKTVKPKEKIAFIALTVSVIWFIIAVIYAYSYLKFSTLDPVVNRYWAVFIWGLPISFIVVAFFTRKYFKKTKWIYIHLSLALWTLLLSAYLTFIYEGNYWFLFFIGIPAQISLILLMYFNIQKE